MTTMYDTFYVFNGPVLFHTTFSPFVCLPNLSNLPNHDVLDLTSNFMHGSTRMMLGSNPGS